MAAKSNVVVSEGQVTFKRVEGHKHDGLTSTLIDTSKYSMFDFIATENSRDASRAARQQNNKNVLKTFIIDTIEGRVLNPEGIRIQANAISAREIIAGTITADELSSNIVLVNNVIRSNNFINNTTTQTGWAIYSNGTGIFNNIQIRGNLVAGTGVYANTNTPIFANIGGYFSLGSNFTWNGSTLTIKGTLQFPDGSTPGTFDNGDSLTDGFIGGININANEIQSNSFSAGSAGFRIGADGNAEFNNVTVRGALAAGSVGGLSIENGDLVAGDVVGDGTDGEYVTIDSGGYVTSYRQDPSIGFGTFWTRIDMNLTNPGITVTGTASGSTQATRIVSSFIETPTIFLNGTSIATSLAGKSATGHGHTNLTNYVTAAGDTMTGQLNGTSIYMSGMIETATEVRVGGKLNANGTVEMDQGNSASTTAVAETSAGTVGLFCFPTNGSGQANQTMRWKSGTGSSIRFKEYINPIEEATIPLDRFWDLDVVEFQYKDEYGGAIEKERPYNHRRRFGFIAEDAEEKVPYFASYDDDSLVDNVKFDSITAVLYHEVRKMRQFMIDNYNYNG